MIQHMSGLVNLRALYIIHFRNNDMCMWVVRETLRFIVDCVAHNPHLKLEWIAIEERLDRIMRPGELVDEDDEASRRTKTKMNPKKMVNKNKTKKNKKNKKKSLSVGAIVDGGGSSSNNNNANSSGNDNGNGAGYGDGGYDLPILPVDGWDYSDSGSDGDDHDGDGVDGHDWDMKLKLTTVTGIPFFDAWGVKLFTKEIRAGRI